MPNTYIPSKIVTRDGVTHEAWRVPQLGFKGLETMGYRDRMAILEQRCSGNTPLDDSGIFVYSRGGEVFAEHGDWIVQDDKWYLVYSDEDFHSIYQEVKDGEEVGQAGS